MTVAAPTKYLLTRFTDLHAHAFGVPAVLSFKRDAKILADLWRSHPEQLEPLMVAFFAERDPWVMAHGGMTIKMFRYRFASLLLTAKPLRSQLDDNWFDECQRTCGGRCGSRFKHAIFSKRA